jgi:hypothetical protein
VVKEEAHRLAPNNAQPQNNSTQKHRKAWCEAHLQGQEEPLQLQRDTGVLVCVSRCPPPADVGTENKLHRERAWPGKVRSLLQATPWREAHW